MKRAAALRLLLALAGAVVLGRDACAFLPLRRAWASGEIAMQLQLGQSAGTLLDGSTNWDTVAETALNDWNEHMTRTKFAITRASTAARAQRNGLNNVFFSPNVYGEAWGSGVLGVTISFGNVSTGFASEADVLFNSSKTWDSYRGFLRGNAVDFRRVATHEFGHVLGLDHPDEDEPPQVVAAIMNSTISSVDSLQADDIAGAKAIYDVGSGPPVITSSPVSRTVGVGGSYTFTVAATGTGPLTYTWGFKAAGSDVAVPLHFATGPSYTIGSVQTGDAGRYFAIVSNNSALATSAEATLTVTPVATSSDTILVNLSTLGTVGSSASQQLIAGLVIGGTTNKNILLRAVGPALADFGVPGTLSKPQITLVNGTGTTVAQAAAWGDSPDASKFSAAFARLGAFQFKAGSADSAILATLPPGNYTALVSGVGGATGAALVEAYDADADAATSRTRRFANIATRGFVGTDSPMTAGLVVSGPGAHTYLIRAVGITLASSPFNLSGVLIDPFLQLYQGENLLRENDDWDTPSSAQPAIRAAATSVGAFALREERDTAIRSGLDSVMIVTLQPGNYTAKVTGFEGVTGIAIVEIYELP